MKSFCKFILAAALPLLGTTTVRAADWLIATAEENVQGGAPLEVAVVRPDAATAWPERLNLRLRRGDDAAGLIGMHAAPDADADAPRRTYVARLPDGLAGMLRVELADRPSNRLVLLAGAAAAALPARDAIARMATAPGDAPPDPVPEDEPALSANEPMYLVFGGNDGMDARFQLSFKYRLFDARSLPARLFAPLGRMHVGYTQTSLWDLSDKSRPFRDTSYRPSLFWQGALPATPGRPWLPAYLRGGYEHESNGKDGDKSRSIDILFAQPAWRADFAAGRTLFFAPKLFAYLDRDDNRDIARYRGHVDWNLRYGDEAGWVLGARLRRGTAGHGSGQLDLSWPLREPLFARTGGFLHFQLFSGHGETLLDYDRKRSTRLRVGFSIVR
jgi:outer membrane phospholipase A